MHIVTIVYVHCSSCVAQSQCVLLVFAICYCSSYVVCVYYVSSYLLIMCCSCLLYVTYCLLCVVHVCYIAACYVFLITGLGQNNKLLKDSSPVLFM